MNPWQFAAEHPLWSIFLMLAAGAAVAQVVSAIIDPLAPCRRGDCPRCRGTGSDVRVRKGAES